MSEELPASKLGTKEYWDAVYQKEIDNFSKFGDEGEVWFGEESVEKMVDWATEQVPPSSSPFIAEIGVGNGNLLFALADAGYSPDHLCGIDYSQEGIDLARTIATSKRYDDIKLEVLDFLRQDFIKIDGLPEEGWDLLLDKGTYDAMALAEKEESEVALFKQYPARVAEILKPGGFFLITSCNFTFEELLQNFQSYAPGLKYHSRIQYPTMSFGGVTGSTYCSVAFRKE